MTDSVPVRANIQDVESGPEGHVKADDKAATEEADPESDGLPEVLRFLRSPACSPDLGLEQNRKQGNMRKIPKPVDDGKTAHLRRFVGKIVFSIPAQMAVISVILFDCSLIVVGNANLAPEDHVVFKICDALVLTVLTVDVLGRFFHLGLCFLHSFMNIFELLLVPMTFVEVASSSRLPLPILRTLRPIFRVLRVVRVLVKTAGKGKLYVRHLRHQVSGDRIRWTKDGFDLDLAYIRTSQKKSVAQVIAMPAPAVGRDCLLYNAAPEVARFLNEYHPNRYLLLNTTHERRYPNSLFFYRYIKFPIRQEEVPTLEGLYNLCKVLDQYLQEHPENILVVHSKRGQGRVGLVIIALLLYRGLFANVTSAVASFERCRATPDARHPCTQTLDNASQQRFLTYFAYYCQGASPENTPRRTVKLTTIQLAGLDDGASCDVSIYSHCGSGLKGNAPSKRASCVTAAIEPAGEEEEHQLEDEGVETPTKVIATRLRDALDEKKMDSGKSGAQPMTTQPLVTSCVVGPRTTATCTRRSIWASASDSSYPTVWELNDCTFADEFRIEVHRSKKQAVPGRKGDQEEVGDDESEDAEHQYAADADGKEASSEGFFGKLWRCFACCFPRADQDGSQAPVEEGMLFCAWLHTSFLELQETNSDRLPPRLRSQHSVSVQLQRFDTDKALGGPTLRSQSTTMRLLMEFVVDRRMDWRPCGTRRGATKVELLASPAENSRAEVCEWLTWMSRQVWPKFEMGFRKIIEENIVQSLKTSLPAPFNSVNLKSFVLSAGTEPNYPKFKAISASSRTHDGLEVRLDIDLQYITDTNIVLEFPFASLGISHISLKGILSMNFRPILPELPVLTALQLLFINMPEVDICFANSLQVANQPKVRSIIFEKIESALGNLMVLPNVFTVNWADPSSDRLITFESILPCAVVQINVRSVRDVNINGRSLPETFTRAAHLNYRMYAKLDLGTQTAKTSLNPYMCSLNANTLEKNWDEKVDFLVFNEQQHLRVSVFKVDIMGIETLVGTIGVKTVSELAAASADAENCLWTPLVDCSASGSSASVSGEIFLRAELFSLVSDLNSIQSLISRKQNRPHSIAEEDCGDDEQPAKITTPRTPREDIDKPTEDDKIGCSMVLSCEVRGGRIPPELADPNDVDVKVSFGSSSVSQRCSEAEPVEINTVADREIKSIVRLSERGMQADVIADVMGEKVEDVHRILCKTGWNLEMWQKLCVQITSTDLCTTELIEIELLKGKTRIAAGSVTLRELIAFHDSKLDQVIKCNSVNGDFIVQLDVVLRLFVLQRDSNW
eukprot:TRINITY_DN61780_c0_g1_i1.p1 TRINITY_DN61780_c0_g1~~TRINITY_DN61780_c0_g1_i1.p1  ORF type:complete len:1307 (+),score=203.40 TRINITY_DN61780_c0_g1_i1:28-3921(+)